MEKSGALQERIFLVGLWLSFLILFAPGFVFAATTTKDCSGVANNDCTIGFNVGGVSSALAKFEAIGDFNSPYECIQINISGSTVSGPHCNFEKDQWRTLNSNVNVLNKISSDGSFRFLCDVFGASAVDHYTCRITLTYDPCTKKDCIYTWNECNSSGLQSINITQQASCGGTACPDYNVQSCVFLDTPYFANLAQPNVNISSMNFGDTVLLRFPGVNLDEEDITFYVEVQNVSNSVWYNPFTWFGGTKSWSSLPMILGTPYQPFIINSTDKHRLNASAGSDGVFKVSEGIGVENHRGSSDSPKATILSPNSSLRFAANVTINFTQISEDADDLLRIFWNFGDGTNHTAYNYSWVINSTGGDTVHNYTLGGRYYDILLEAKEMTRDQSDTDTTKIYVFQEGINVVPIISSPLPNTIIQNRLVWYNASQSYVVNCSKGFKPVEPSKGFDVEDLGCRYVLFPGAKDPLSGNVSIRWREVDSEGKDMPNGWKKEADIWNSTNYNFSVAFPVVHDKHLSRNIRMEMQYTD